MINHSKKLFFPELSSLRFLIRQLHETDVSEKYVSWFSNSSVREFITAAQITQTVESLKSYVRRNLDSPHSLFLGIFTLDTNHHIGNIKFDHIDVKKGLAIIGVLIGDSAWRGKSVFEEVFKPTVQYLYSTLEIKDFWLGVHPTNIAAIKAYKKTGFRTAKPPSCLIPRPDQTSLYMHYQLL